MLQNYGLISILCMWVGTVILLKHHTPERDKSISKHASKNNIYHIYNLNNLFISFSNIFILFKSFPTYLYCFYHFFVYDHLIALRS